MARQIGVNTLVFQSEMQEGTKKQFEYFEELKEAGFPFVEVRREYFRDLEAELEETAEEAAKVGLHLYYSVPDSLFHEGQLNQQIKTYFQEAERLQARQVKLTLGVPPHSLKTAFKELQAVLQEWETIRLSIENDQTVEAGSAKVLADFTTQASLADVPVKLTFDTGNFVYIGENPEEAAYILRDFTGYVHLKNVTIPKADQIDLALFETGDFDLGRVLEAFREAVPAAIEYPCGSPKEAMQVLRSELEKVRKI